MYFICKLAVARCHHLKEVEEAFDNVKTDQLVAKEILPVNHWEIVIGKQRKKNIVIMGPKECGKTTTLYWLYHQ